MKKMYVQEIIDYVESNIEEPMNVELISKHIGYSRHYLHRLFSIYTGMYLMDYVRKRKLEYSLMDLQTDLPIIDIAIKYSFNSSRTYSRAFQNVYGLSPGKFRRNTLQLSPKIILQSIGGINMLTYLSESKTVKLDNINALAHRIVSKEPEDDVIKFMKEYSKDNNLTPITEVGFDIPISEEESSNGLRGYEYWLVLDKESYDLHNPKAVEKITVPKCKYLMLTISDPFLNPFERIPNGWKKVWSEVENNHEFMKDFLICGLEEVVTTLEGTSMNIYVPIK